MTKYANRSDRERREKKAYDGQPVPEGYVLTPVWLSRDFVRDAPDIRPENISTRTYAGIRFLIGYVAVPPELSAPLKRDCDAQINAYLRKRRSGRCVIGYRQDGSPRLCPKDRHCTGCVHRGEYERLNPAKAAQGLLIEDFAEKFGGGRMCIRRFWTRSRKSWSVCFGIRGIWIPGTAKS